MKWSRPLSTLLVAAALVVPTSLEAQASVGVYGSHLTDSFDGATGFGLRATLSFPLLPLTGYANGERVFPDCEIDGCSSWAGEVGLELTVFPLPAARPYITGSLMQRRFKESDLVDEVRVEGVAVGAGIAVGIGFSAFGEIKYEFLDGDGYDQVVLRVGLMF